MGMHLDPTAPCTLAHETQEATGPITAGSAFPAIDLSWREACPFRPPSWRWGLANRLLTERLPRRPETQDPWVQRIVKHLRSIQGVESSRRHGRCDRLIAEAAAIRFAPDPLIRSELEAWILTGEPVGDVAKLAGYGLDVVEAYEQSFFDVRHKLNAPSYVLHVVIGPGLYEGFHPDDLAPILKWVAYYRGRHMLATTLRAYPGSRGRPWPAWYPASAEEQDRLIRACRRAILARCIPREVSGAKQIRLILQLQAAAEADFQASPAPYGPLVSPLTGASVSEEPDGIRGINPVLSPVGTVIETRAATASKVA